MFGQDLRAFAASRFILELDGQNVGVLGSVDGGHFKAGMVSEARGAPPFDHRFPGRESFDDLVLQVGTSMAPGFWRWIKASLDHQYERRSGAILACDFDGRERSRRTFFDALIAEVQFPALDAQAKSPAYLTVKIAPERMDYQRIDGGSLAGGVPVSKQKMWVPANFQLTIEGIGSEMTKHVVRIDPIVVKQSIIVNPVGNELCPRKEPGRLEPPTLTIHVAETYAKPWFTWWKASVEHGMPERTGSVAFLGADCTTRLMMLHFAGIGVTGVGFDRHEAGSENLRMAKVEMVTEGLTFEPGAGTL